MDLSDYAHEQLSTLIELAMIDRLVAGSQRHAKRRIDEMQAVAEMLRELDIEPHVSLAARERLRSLSKE
ncbi:MAG: DUF1932 domain-containing protein [Trueperaceae bacterium]